jgi:hypothetical protein
MNIEYIPYFPENLAQILELHTAVYVPTNYGGWFLFFLQIQQKGRLLAWGAKQMVAANLGVIRQRAISSK